MFMSHITCRILVIALIGTVRGEVQDGCSKDSGDTDMLLLQVSNEIYATDEPSSSSQVKAPELHKELQEKLQTLPKVVLAPNVSGPALDAPVWWSSVDNKRHRPLADHVVGAGDGFRLIFNFTGAVGENTVLPKEIIASWPWGLLLLAAICVFVWLSGCVQGPTLTSEAAAEDEEDGVKSISKTQLFFLAQVSAIGMMSQDMYIPNMVEMAESLGVSSTMESLTLEVNWITSAFTCVTIGLISDKFGRRPLMIFCFITYIMGSLGTALSTNIVQAVSFRILQGTGEACMVLPVAIVRDLVTDSEERGKINAIYSVVGTTGVVLAPTIGGVMGSFFGWRSVFLILGAWGTCLLGFTMFCLPESCPRLLEPQVQTEADEGMSGARKNFGEFVRLLKRGGCPCLALIWVQVFFSATIMSMLCAFPFVIEDGRGLSTLWCSLFMIAFAVFVMVGVAINVKLKDGFNWGNDSLIPAGLNVFTFAGLSFLTLALCTSTARLTPLILILIPPCVLTLSGGIMNGPLNAKYMEHFGPVAGTAAGVLNTLNSILTSGYAYSTTYFVETIGEIGWTSLLACGILTGAVGYAGLKNMGGGMPPEKEMDQ